MPQSRSARKSATVDHSGLVVAAVTLFRREAKGRLPVVLWLRHCSVRDLHWLLPLPFHSQHQSPGSGSIAGVGVSAVACERPATENAAGTGSETPVVA